MAGDIKTISSFVKKYKNRYLIFLQGTDSQFFV